MSIFDYWLHPPYMGREKTPSWNDLNIWKSEHPIIEDSDFWLLYEALINSENGLKKAGKKAESKGVKRARLRLGKLLRKRKRK